MKKFLAALALCCTISGLAFAQDNYTIKVGQKAPELKFKNPKGEVLELSKINKDRIVLIDFWASWCRPCRAANPRLVAMYNNYKDKSFKSAKKGFTVVSVSLDQNKDSWIKAINDDKLSWEYHMSDLGSWNSKAAELYGVQFIPQAFLVGADGTIIGMYSSAEEAASELEKMLK